MDATCRARADSSDTPSSRATRAPTHACTPNPSPRCLPTGRLADLAVVELRIPADLRAEPVKAR
jgi:hypothetical protein